MSNFNKFVAIGLVSFCLVIAGFSLLWSDPSIAQSRCHGPIPGTNARFEKRSQGPNRPCVYQVYRPANAANPSYSENLETSCTECRSLD
jgi:hypothetical protein